MIPIYFFVKASVGTNFIYSLLYQIFIPEYSHNKWNTPPDKNVVRNI